MRLRQFKKVNIYEYNLLPAYSRDRPLPICQNNTTINLADSIFYTTAMIAIS